MAHLCEKSMATTLLRSLVGRKMTVDVTYLVTVQMSPMPDPPTVGSVVG